MCARVSAGLRELADDRAEQVGLTRFFRNPRVTVDEILRSAAERTGAAAAGRHVLLIEDTSEINYQSKAKRKRGLGRVGNGADVGLFVHPALAIDAEDGAVLGLAGATIWRRTRVKEDDYQSLPIEEKESHRWIATALKARTFLSAAALVTLIADREADIYELFARVPDEQTHVLVRAVRDRALADVGGRMLSKIAAVPEAGRLAFDLPGRPGRTARQVTLAVRFCPVTLRQPARGADRRDPSQLSLTLVEAREIDPPPCEEPIVWRLLTTHAATTLAEAARIIDLYRRRWIIEEAFKNLKGDLAIRPIFHQSERRIEAHIFVAFLAYYLQITLTRRLHGLAPGLTARSALAKFAAVQMIDVHLPTTDGREIVLTRTTEPEPDLRLLLDRINLTLPAQPPPRIAAAALPAGSSL